ncbi:hypothetical protein AVEN_44796-1 [Araneus ventricosus]|uniref:Uncharacterized protein n=1 Tax=Araneus ventricosus TaxID=182803 RepID=A0A4Y2K2R1_ARAVE|nr:hypothetical protein AVEN_44796-1 [Araneus ventricosus]
MRELVLRRTLNCRQIIKVERTFHEFYIPTLNFKADDYVHLFDWHSVTLTEPPLTVSISDNELKEMILDIPVEIDILRFLCYLQAVEHCVKLVTEASAAMCGSDARDGFIRSRITSRMALPKSET